MTRARLVTAALVAAVAFWAWSLPPRRVILVPSFDDGTVRGLLHVHSRLSDGMGTADEIAAAAARAGAQFIVLTDHGDGTRRPEPPAYREGVLVLDGVEISTRGGHYVAIGLPQSPYALGGDPADVVEDVRRMHGFGIVAHPDSPKAELRWADWSAPFDGIELINPDTSWRVRASGDGYSGKWLLVRSLLAYPVRPAEAITQLLTDTRSLSDRWTAMLAERKVVAVAGVDAHAKLQLVDRDPGDNSFSLSIPGYAASFESISVHIRPSAPFSGDAQADAGRLIQGLRAGAAFVAVDGWASPAAFEFSATSGQTRCIEGETIEPSAPVLLHVRSNAPPGFRTIVRKGLDTLVERTETEFDVPVGQDTATYSVEIRRDVSSGPAWIISNPIYVGEPRLRATVASPTPGRTVRALFDGRTLDGWSRENDAVSAAALDVVPFVGGSMLHMRFGLAGGTPVGQFTAATVDTAAGVDGTAGVAFRVHASAEMRVAVMVRAEVPGAAPERWEQSVYVSPSDAEHVIRFADMTSVGPTHSPRAPLAGVRSILFVMDTTNTKPGTSGQLWLGEVRLVRD